MVIGWMPPVQANCCTVLMEIGVTSPSIQPAPRPLLRSSPRTLTSTVGAAAADGRGVAGAGEGVDHGGEHVVPLLLGGACVAERLGLEALLLGEEYAGGCGGDVGVEESVEFRRDLGHEGKLAVHQPVAEHAAGDHAVRHGAFLRRFETVWVDHRTPDGRLDLNLACRAGQRRRRGVGRSGVIDGGADPGCRRHQFCLRAIQLSRRRMAKHRGEPVHDRHR